MMNKYIMALDLGTTSCRCMIYDKTGQIISSAQKSYPLSFPQNGWVEQDASELWNAQLAACQRALAKSNLDIRRIHSIGITNQRETTIVWNRKTGQPVYNAIVWQCRRTAEYCRQLADEGYSEMIREKTGLLPDAYFSGSKLKWILDHVEGARDAAERGELLFGTAESWLIWNLSGGEVHVTDYSNAARTMMFNIHEMGWDPELLRLLEIPAVMLPTCVSCSEVYGYTKTSLFGVPIPISGAAGDQQSSLFGHTCFERGQTKMTFGTGGFMLMNTGDTPVLSKAGLLATVAWDTGKDRCYALEGSVFMSGAIIKWLRDDLKIIDTSAETEELALEAKDNGGVYLVPAFSGLGAPYWDPQARGCILGLSGAAGRNEIVRAALECQAYQTLDLMEAMQQDTDHRKLSSIMVDGGASANDFLMQFLADILDMEVLRPQNIETTSLGAAYLAGLSTGYWESKEEIRETTMSCTSFTPRMKNNERAELIEKWRHAVECARSFR